MSNKDNDEFYNLIIVGSSMFIVGGLSWWAYGPNAGFCAIASLFAGIFIRRDLMK